MKTTTNLPTIQHNHPEVITQNQEAMLNLTNLIDHLVNVETALKRLRREKILTINKIYPMITQLICELKSEYPDASRRILLGVLKHRVATSHPILSLGIDVMLNNLTFNNETPISLIRSVVKLHKAGYISRNVVKNSTIKELESLTKAYKDTIKVEKAKELLGLI